MLKQGDQAPDFSLLDQDEQTQTLSDYLGQWVLVYIYPKDDTPGCTKEACTIAEVYTEFAQLGVKVFGLSKDSPQSHKAFAEKYHLPFTLLADETTQTLNKYGALVEKEKDGELIYKTARISYLIDPTGKVVKVYPQVDPASHALQLLTDIKTAQSENLA